MHSALLFFWFLGNRIGRFWTLCKSRLVKIHFTASNYNIQLTFLNPNENKSELNVYAFLSYISTEDAPINEKTCSLYEKARFHIPGPNLFTNANYKSTWLLYKYKGI